MSPRRLQPAATRANADQATNDRNGPKAVMPNGNQFASSLGLIFMENPLT
jgi:hypothetical protein